MGSEQGNLTIRIICKPELQTPNFGLRTSFAAPDFSIFSRPKQIQMKKTHFLFLALIAGVFVFISAKIPKAARQKIMQGDAFFAQEDYAAALPLYEEAFKIDGTNANVAFKIGVSCLNIPRKKHDAEKYLFLAVSNISEGYREGSMKETHAPPSAWFFYGEALHLNNKFTEALTAFEKYKSFVDVNDTKTAAEIALRMRWCTNGIELVANPVNIKVENIGENINSEFADYSPVISADQRTLIFTSRRPSTTGGQQDPNDGLYYEDIYISTRSDSGAWSPATQLGNNINTAGHEATIGLSADGQQLLIYKDDAGDGNVYISRLMGKNWMTPQKLTENINTKSWEPSACITPDGNTLYFTSTREGGLGGRDIWRSVKLPNGEWSKATNLGPKINTPYDEDAPAILADGLTLYYSSNGMLSMGGFDIMYATFSQDSGWSNPVNVGYPVNTSDDDVFFVPTPDNTHAYYSSANNPNGKGEKDIFLLTFPEKEGTKLTVLEGSITSIYGGIPENTIITVTDVETGEMMGTYVPNSVTGRYVIILPAGKNYSITYEATDFLYQSDNVNVSDTTSYQEIERPVELEPLKVGQKIIVRNIFFASGQSALQPESKAELDKLVDLLNRVPNLTVEISGHTDAAGSDELNQKLSEQRAKAVADYIIAHGISKDRIRTVGYGETKPIALNYNSDGSPNAKGMALNRRFEFTILSTNGVLPDVVEPIKVPANLQNKGK
jgi:outer membrane protein OmpA-like peptidoglycan-associated protein